MILLDRETLHFDRDKVRRHLGDAIIKERVKKGWNQSELARQAAKHMPDNKFGRDNVSKYEKGISLPTPLYLNALAKALGVDRAHLLPSSRAIDSTLRVTHDRREHVPFTKEPDRRHEGGDSTDMLAKMKPVVSQKTVADLIGVSSRTIQRWTREGLLKSAFSTPGGQCRYLKTDVEALVVRLSESGEWQRVEGRQYLPQQRPILDRGGRSAREAAGEVPWMGQRDNGYFYAHWYDADRRQTYRKSLRTRNCDAAKRRFGEFLIRADQLPRSQPLTVSQALDDYVRRHVDDVDDRGRARVVDGRRLKIAIAYLKKAFGDKPVKDIGPLECRAFMEARRSGAISGGITQTPRPGAKDSTLTRELSVLVAAANHAVRWGTLDRNDLPRVERPRVSGREVQALTKQEIALLLAAAKQQGSEDLHDFILLAYYTASRRRAIEMLSKFQVNLAVGSISLHSPGAQVTKKRKPTVPIYPEIRSVIERRMDLPGSELFPDRAKGGFYDAFVALSLAVLKRHAYPHQLRHSRASHMLQDGESLFKVAKLLGDTTQTVERTYAHFLPSDLLTHSRL